MSSEETQPLGFYLRSIGSAVRDRCDAAYAAVGVERIHVGIALAIKNYPGLNQGEYARLGCTDETTFGRQVNTMIERGLVRRTKKKMDGRALGLELTEAGLVFLEEAQPILSEVEQSVLDGLSPEEQRTFWKLARRIHESLSTGQ